jgi:hypothetical protein
MLADELYCMIRVPRFKDEDAAELFCGFDRQGERNLFSEEERDGSR